MSNKRVFVRLAAVGGKQVKAELQGIGDAGHRGLGRLSREVDAANLRLAALTRRMQLAAVAAGAALAAAGVAMVRSGLQTVDAQAKLAQSLDTTVVSMQVLERAGELAGVSMSGVEQATKDMTRRLSQAAASGGPAVAALDRLNLSAETLLGMPLDQRIAAVSAAMMEFVPEAERAAVAGQIFGEEGSIAMSRIDTAVLQQAAQDVRDFGVAVSEQDADQIERTNDALSRLSLIGRGMANQLTVAVAPALEAVADALAAVARGTGPVGQAIRDVWANLDRLGTYAATFAAFLAGRWVAGLAVAALSVRGLATALVVLRGALIRTGIGAIIVGAGELVYQFTKLVEGAGGFGNAMGLLKDLAVEVWDRIGQAAGVIPLYMESAAEKMKAHFLWALHDMLAAFEGMLSDVASGLNSVFGTELNTSPLMSQLTSLNAGGNDAFVAGEAAGNRANEVMSGVTAPLDSWQAMQDAIDAAGTGGTEALERANDAAGSLEESLNDVGGAAKGAGAANKEAAEEAKTGWAAVTQSLADYATEAMDWGKGLGGTLVNAFNSAESAFRQFITTGKLDFKSLVGSILADLATLAFKNAVLGPLANALSGVFGGIFHSGGVVGFGGSSGMVPAAAFAGAPRMHTGGWAGLKPDEVPSILQRGERVLSKSEAAHYGGSGGGSSAPVFQIDARGAQMGVAEQIEARLRSFSPEVERIAKSAVADARRRGQQL